MNEPKTKSKPKTPTKKIVKPKESKEVYFVRIAKPRVQNILKSIRILGNCSNRNNYAYTQEQIDKISEVIYSAMSDMLNKFTPSKQESESFEF